MISNISIQPVWAHRTTEILEKKTFNKTNAFIQSALLLFIAFL